MEHQGCAESNHDITVINLKNGDMVSHSLLLLKGVVSTRDMSHCDQQLNASVCVIYPNDPLIIPQQIVCPVINREFKCLLSLKRGTNAFVLKFCSVELLFDVVYIVRPTLFCVTPVYIICRGHDGRFQSPDLEDNSIESACERISLGIRLIQTLFAEKLFECGYGRKTFQLNHELVQGADECIVFYSNLSVEQAWEMAPAALWEYFGRELMTSNLASTTKKYVAFISCTKYSIGFSNQLPKTYEDILALTKAHAALGGGGLALFGSACLHTWPSSVEEAIPRFLCSTKINKALFMDDSCYRGTYGACFSTTLGSVCHELGHTFDLGHTKEGIMGSGFHNFQHVFTVQDQHHEQTSRCDDLKSFPLHKTVSFSRNLQFTFEDKSSNNGNSTKMFEYSITDEKSEELMQYKGQRSLQSSESCIPEYQKGLSEDDTFWSDSCTAILAHHRWMNPTTNLESKNSLCFNKKSKFISSPVGIRVIEIRDSEGMVFQSWVFKLGSGQQDFSLPSKLILDPGSYIFAMDTLGNSLKETIEASDNQLLNI